MERGNEDEWRLVTHRYRDRAEERGVRVRGEGGTNAWQGVTVKGDGVM